MLYRIRCFVTGMLFTTLVLNLIFWRPEGVWAMIALISLDFHLFPRLKKLETWFKI